MEKLTSILIVVDHSERDEPLVAKALALARKTNARIELFSCDASHEYELRRAYVARGVEAARRASIEAMRAYLQHIADRIAAEDRAVSIEAVSDTPLYESIIHKVLGSGSDLVMKAAAKEFSGGHAKFGANDWQLVRASPVPLLLSRGRSWPPRPRFAAVVDVSEEQIREFAPKLLRTTETLNASGGGSRIEVLFGESAATDERSREIHAATVRRLTEDIHIDGSLVRRLTGDPAIKLPAIAAQQPYDVLVLSAVAPPVGTLTRKLMETLDCDFVLVKGTPPSFKR